MKEESRKNGIEQLASHRIHGILPEKYHMKYRSGQEELVEDKSLQEIEQLIRQTGETMDVPEGLLPENMGRKLAFVQKKKKRRRFILVCVTGLVVLFLIIAAVTAWNNRHLNQNYTDLNHIVSYDELYEYYAGLIEKRDPYACSGNASNLSAVMFSASSAAYQTNDKEIDHTSINVREKGIGEGDFTVTDGKYIYTISCVYTSTDKETGLDRYQNRITIQKAEGKRVHQTALIEDDYESAAVQGWEAALYVQGDILVVMYQEADFNSSYGIRCTITFYDISDRTSPKLLKSTAQRGKYLESRVSAGYFYLISRVESIPVAAMKREREEIYVPMVNEKKLPADDIYLQKDAQGNAFLLITSWNLSRPGECTDAKALVGYYNDVYMTDSNLYLSNMICPNEKTKQKTDLTRITKISYEKGLLTGKAMTSFPGKLGSSFAIREQGDHLWVTSEVDHYKYWDFEKNDADEKMEDSISWNKIDDYNTGRYIDWTDVSVYTFDCQLRQMDSITGLVKNESVYSVRYIGQIGYFVSYEKIEETDPLVSIDFSDEYHLKVLDELVMPGFSSYLHPVKDNLLLGIGYDVENNVKLAMYDVSAPENIKEKDQKSLDGIWKSSVFQEYKRVFIDEKNQLIGFDGSDSQDDSYYFVYHYDRQDGLKLVKRIALSGSPEGIGEWQGFRIGKYLYLLEKQSEQGQIRVVELP